MKNNPKVSIIIPVYNGANYVEEAINSALSQTYKNIEIIVVNDGSVDNTETVLEKYKDKVKYIKKENGGVSTALNLAIENMTGDYFSWLSHDDLYKPNKIEEELKEIEENTIIMSDYDTIDSKGKLIKKIILPHEVIEKNYEKALLNGLINGITLLIPKQAFDKVGKFNEVLKCTQDYDMWLRMILKGYKFKHIPKILASSRQHANQTTNKSPNVLTEGNELWKNIIEAFSDEIKIKISYTLYNYYKEMSLVLKETVYKEAYTYCIKKMQETKNNEDIENIKASIIIPFYDEDINTLKRSINSALNQTHKNIEIILINDNPEKYNDEELKEIINNDKIKYIKNIKNLGVSASRNKGIEESTGDFIAFLDADDSFLETKIDKQLKEMLNTTLPFSHTSYYKIDSKKEEVMNSGTINGLAYRECIRSCRIATPTVMIKKSFLNENNIRFNEKLSIGEDTCFWLEMLTKTEIAGIEEPLTKVYINEKSAAYDIEKQIIGLRNILEFIFKNDILNKCYYEIAALSRSYSYVVFKDTEEDYMNIYYEFKNRLSVKLTEPFRLMYKTFSSIKEAGLDATIKKIGRYLCKEK